MIEIYFGGPQERRFNMFRNLTEDLVLCEMPVSQKLVIDLLVV
jgi:hypothetical protein